MTFESAVSIEHPVSGPCLQGPGSRASIRAKGPYEAALKSRKPIIWHGFPLHNL